METVYIPHLLNRSGKQLSIAIDEHLSWLDTLTPVRGSLSLVHCQTYLEVRATLETILTLVCDRCLQNYNYRVAITPQELIWLQADPPPGSIPLEQEVGLDDLVESLPPNGHFDGTTWVYEQICLALPQRQLCSAACSGLSLSESGNGEIQDRRWSALSQLQQRLQNQDS
ncbi:MAG: YceD family protein [Nodosilinea sp. LVE1205-7]|jgi:uncharacterized protein